MLAKPELQKKQLSLQAHNHVGFSKPTDKPEAKKSSLEQWKTIKKRNPMRRSNKKISKNTVNIKLIQTNMDGYTLKKKVFVR